MKPLLNFVSSTFLAANNISKADANSAAENSFKTKQHLNGSNLFSLFFGIKNILLIIFFLILTISPSKSKGCLDFLPFGHNDNYVQLPKETEFCIKYRKQNLIFKTDTRGGRFFKKTSENAIQVFGGYGYTKDQGIEQLFRDNRITPIYEGTNSVQAIDLVYRKISSEGIFENFIKSMDNEIKNYKNEKNLESFLNIFEKYKEILVSFTKWMREKINSNKDDASAACNDYLKVLGYTALAFAWIKTLKISFEKQNSNKEFYEDKINTGKYYFEKILPRAQSHYVVGTSGSHTTMNAKFN